MHEEEGQGGGSDAHRKHGSESFFIEGEGLVGTAVGGRSGDEADPLGDDSTSRSGAATSLAAGAAPPFRFSRVGPRGTPLGKALTRKLARAMVDSGGGQQAVEGKVPAGYTYLGQFIDHDLTMDRTAVMLGENVSPTDLLQGRSPRLDLDSLYGAGPASARSARFFEAESLHLTIGDTVEAPPDGPKVGHDLPRVGKGRTRRARLRALIPDPRNDENLIVAQTHVAMIRFHNRVTDSVPASVPDAQRFAHARKQVTMHYQWLIRHDYLPRICRPAVLDDVFTNGRVLVEPDAAPTAVPTMPIEFSVEAFRLGHSMIRESYNWNRIFAGTGGGLQYMFDFSGLGDLGRNLPPRVFGGSDAMQLDDVRRNLAFRNLTRAGMVRLATGQQMALRLSDAGVATTALTRSELLEGAGGARLTGLTKAEQEALATRTPLWFYLLREAEINGGRLRGVGSRIVAETFHRTMEGSRFSVVREPDWRPTLGRGDTFEMTDLLFFALRGSAGLNPLGVG